MSERTDLPREHVATTRLTQAASWQYRRRPTAVRLRERTSPVKISKASWGTAVGFGLVALSITGVGAAHADTNAGSTSTLAMVGSDTSQDVMEGLSSVLKDSSNNPLLSNYKAIPVGRTITTRTGNANCVFTVAKNSGEGRDALSAALRGATFAGSPATAGGTVVTSANMTGCVDVARSSSGGNPTTSPGVGTMTYVPFATDSVTYATLASSSVPHTLNKSDLVAIYTANTPNCIFSPLLPSAGSGTRSFWATTLGLSDSFGAGGWGNCVKDVNSAGTAIQEHDGRFLTNGQQLIPISTAQFIAQQAGVISDIRGRASLGSIDFDGAGGANAISPVSLQPTFGTNTRPLYNVVSTAAITTGDPAFNQKVVDTFVGTTSKVCSSTLTIQQYGLAPLGTCGDTSKKNTN